jgi:leucyl aminopeptidase (aminopeptidase T)
MAFTERYGSPHTRIIDLVKAWDIPFEHVRAGDKFCIFSDSGMDPLVWESAMAALRQRDAEVVMCFFPRLPHHNADPSEMAVAAARSSDVVVALTTTALNSGTPAMRTLWNYQTGTGIAPVWLMEEMTVEILTQGGGTVTKDELLATRDLNVRIGQVYDGGKTIQLRSRSGTDLTARIDGYAPGASAKRWGKLPFVRDAAGKFGNAHWPWGEIHIEPAPGTANGTVVWDTTGHHPAGQWREPVKLTIVDGRVVDIAGGAEAEQVRTYLETNGDENSYLVGGEIALGTNPKCLLFTGQMRSEKKRYGTMHFGIGQGSDRGIVKSKLRYEGITSNVTIIVDNTVVCEDGRIKV